MNEETLIKRGEIITLDNNKEYLCCATATDNGISYVYLMSNFKPLEIKFARQQLVNNELEITIIGNQAEKVKVLQLLQEQNKM